jgi:O-antigen ligase
MPIAAAAAFTLWILSSTTWATDRYQAIHLGFQWGSYVLFFFVMSLVASARTVRASFISFAIIIWVLAIACCIESWFGAPLTDSSLRYDLKPLLRGSSGFGEIMGAACILFASFALHLRRRGVAVMCGATSIAAWLATMQSLERAPFIGSLAGLALLTIGVFFRSSRRAVYRWTAMAALFAAIVCVEALPSRLRVNEVSTVDRLSQRLDTDPNTRVRLLFWGVGLELLRANPVMGVGANNYQASFPEGRAQFAARYPTSPLISLNDHLLTLYTHNEYIQIAAELGIVGLLLFLVFSATLIANFVKSQKSNHSRLPMFGAAGAMLAFAVSSGASASSFRYVGGALTFFFAASLIARRLNRYCPSMIRFRRAQVPSPTLRIAQVGIFASLLVSVAVLTTHGIAATSQGLAEGSSGNAEQYYRASLKLFPVNAATHFSYGMWLYVNNRSPEGVPHLRYALSRGFNSSINYACLAAAEEAAGDLPAAERTLSTAVHVYPSSVFLLVKDSDALHRLGQDKEANDRFERASALDSRAARGWQQLITNDIDAAYRAAKQDSNIALPQELSPESAVIAVLRDNERRFPQFANTGWRARMRSPLIH